MLVKQIIFAAVLATSAYAQESTATQTSSGVLPTSTSDLSSCITKCVTSSTGCTFGNATCVCTDLTYQQEVLGCLRDNCTPEELETALGLQASLCGSTSYVSLPTSSLSSVLSGISSSLSSRGSSASSRSSATSSPTSTAGGSGGAAGLSASLATGGAVLLGIIGGGLLVF